MSENVQGAGQLTRLAERILKMRIGINAARDTIGEELVQMIVTRVRLGYGVEDMGQQKKKFASLRPSTIEHRSKMNLFPGSTPERSHLTMTGDMMNNLTYEKPQEDQLTLLFSSQFAKLKAAWAHSGSRNRKPRPFMFLTSSELKRVNQILKKYMNEYVDSLVE